MTLGLRIESRIPLLELASEIFIQHSPPWAGLLSTAGGLVFGGSSEGMFFALDAGSGKPLWHFPTGGPIYANPVSFLVDGKQHVTIAAGQALFGFALD